MFKFYVWHINLELVTPLAVTNVTDLFLNCY